MKNDQTSGVAMNPSGGHSFGHIERTGFRRGTEESRNPDKGDEQIGSEKHLQKVELYTVEEAAEILRLKTTWLYERTRKNAIPYHRFGKYIRFTAADLDELVKMAAIAEAETGNGRL